MKYTDIPKLPRTEAKQYEYMTDAEKRTYLLQLKQEDTMEWQRTAAQLIVYTFSGIVFIGLPILMIYLYMK
jgi:hypothetical protein